MILHKRSDTYRCGGSIISTHHILTAAHCLDGTKRYPLEDFIVITGEHDTTDSDKTLHTVSEVAKHPKYKKVNGVSEYDVAIFTLSSPITFSIAASPVCLPASVTPQYTDELATVTGWGVTVQCNAGERCDESVAETLQEVNVTVVSNRECTKALRPYEGREAYRYIDKIVKHHL